MILLTHAATPTVVTDTMKFSEAVRNARLDALETVVLTSAVLKLRSGPPPAAIADPDTGAVLVSMTLPSDWMAAAAGGAKAKQGIWQTTASGAGTPGHFRIYASGGVVQHVQGTVTAVGGGGDMEINPATLAAGQTVTVDLFVITDGNG